MGGELGICLSGGAARGIMHLGVLQALEENNIFPTHISGSSIGSIIGALYAEGYSPRKIQQFIGQKSFFKYVRMSGFKDGLFTLTHLEHIFRNYIPHDSFDRLLKKLYICIAEQAHPNKYRILSSGELLKAVKASSAVPFLFSSVKIDGKHYMDGGFANNLPTQPLNQLNIPVIAVHINKFDTQNKSGIKKLFLKKINHIFSKFIIAKDTKYDVLIEPKMPRFYRAFNFKKSEQLFQLGYNETLKHIESIILLDK